MTRWTRALGATLLCLPMLAQALQLAGVEVPRQVSVQGIEQPLLLNGAGVRKKFFVKVYVAGLYLPQPQRDAAQLLAAPPPNRVLMHFVHSEVSREKMDAAWLDGFEANLGQAQFSALRPRLQQFMDLFGTLYQGDRVWLDHLPGQGTRVSINGELRGVVPGSDFNAALLAVWLGAEPVTDSLKKGLLGADR